MRLIFAFVFLCGVLKGAAQNYPSFGNEINVTINGLTFDAMEPFVSDDGSVLFFNSLNDGNTTSLYYATRVNDSTFTFVGALNGANQAMSPRLDAVASIDTGNHFYWISTRDYPSSFDNLFHGTFNGSDVVNIGRVHGNIYVYAPGWLIMDAAINTSGNLLYYCNAYFNNCGPAPCQAKLGIAQKLNDSTFSKLSNSDGLLDSVNNPNYIVYAPNISSDGLELYFTRILISSPIQSDICVSVRNSVNDTFSAPSVLISGITIPEAATLTGDKQKMYYHRRSNNLYEIKLKYRLPLTGIATQECTDIPDILFPNPADDQLFLRTDQFPHGGRVLLFNALGELLREVPLAQKIAIDDLAPGIYFVQIEGDGKFRCAKFVKE